MKFTLGTKVSMTQIFDSEGVAYPATILSAGPVTVTALRTAMKDGYTAVQVGFGTKSEARVNKAQRKQGLFRHVAEFRVAPEALESYKVGDKIDLSVFKEGDLITATSVSKGKGFQGAVKRHHFKGGSRTHGQKHSEREVGSINGGGRVGSGRVAKGKRMPGRMGGDIVTVKNLKVLQVRPESNELVLHGSLPGPKGVLVSIVA